ncbi:hypothetical protein [Allocoleopsis sp.]|uniref:hypothetical protein n=1 Tax=Allocoleopsis sp. TaxID=3088169 RepID=UPI002FD417BD
MDSRNEVTITQAPQHYEVGCQATSIEMVGWFKKQKPNPKRRVMPEKGWRNCRDKQT